MARCCCGSSGGAGLNFDITGDPQGLTGEPLIMVGKSGPPANGYALSLNTAALARHLADNKTVTVTEDGKLAATGGGTATPFSCKDLDNCIDGITIVRLADGKLHIGCVGLFNDCNVQPALSPMPGSGILLTQPSDPTTDPAPLDIDAAELITGRLLGKLALLLSPQPNLITVEGDGTLSAFVHTADSAAIELSGDGTDINRLQANLMLSEAAGNTAALNSDGLYVPAPTPPEQTAHTADTPEINLGGDGTIADPIRANLRLSGGLGNRASINPDGLYVPPVNIADTATVDLSGTGSPTNALSAVVKISGNEGNLLAADGDGLYAAAPPAPVAPRTWLTATNVPLTIIPTRTPIPSWTTKFNDLSGLTTAGDTITFGQTGFYHYELRVWVPQRIDLLDPIQEITVWLTKHLGGSPAGNIARDNSGSTGILDGDAAITLTGVLEVNTTDYGIRVNAAALVPANASASLLIERLRSL